MAFAKLKIVQKLYEKYIWTTIKYQHSFFNTRSKKKCWLISMIIRTIITHSLYEVRKALVECKLSHYRKSPRGPTRPQNWPKLLKIHIGDKNNGEKIKAVYV